MKNEELLFEQSVQALRSAAPAEADLAASSNRIAERLGLSASDVSAEAAAIESCADVQRLLPAYRLGKLSHDRALLIQAHLSDCSACRHQFNAGSRAKVLDWSAPRPARAFTWQPRAAGWALAAGILLSASGLFVYKTFWQVPPGVRAEVQSIDGSAYRISNAGDRPLAPGDSLAEGDQIRTSGGAHAVLRLSDGSTIEVNERSALAVGERGRNTTVTLDDGDLIIQATKRTTGHLYVKTPDCRVAVIGTVFSVDSGLKGSRVAVLAGTVDVSHSGIETLVHAGDQVSTTDKLTAAPVEQQIAWSHDRDKYLPLLAQLATLQHRIEQIPFPAPRYTSDLLQRVPANTLLYVTIPNLGEFLTQANQIFHQQLDQSPVLQQWWAQGGDQKTAMLDMLVDKIHQTSQYLGDEIVIVGVKQPGDPGLAILTDVKRPGLADFLRTQFAIAGPGIKVFDGSTINAAQASSTKTKGGFALVLADKAIFSNSIATLKLMNTQLNAGDSGFATQDFGKQISAAYSRGAGIILAADLHQMIVSSHAMAHMDAHGQDAASLSGIQDVQYLIAEHREINSQPENHLTLQFAGNRKGIASWLAAPAPIGSLNFVSPNASVAVAMLSKDPKAIVDDLLSMVAAKNGDGMQNVEQAESKLGINFREDIAASLGGDVTVSLDGPVLPTPSWKAVVEVHDAQRLEAAMERLTGAIRQNTQGKQAHSITIESSDVNGQRFYAIHDTVTGNTFAQYTFAEGYMILAPSRALVMAALQTNASGDSLAHSAAFRALLPKDASENYSAVAYQNLSPVLTPLLSQLSEPSGDTLRQLASDARPTAICARGEDNRIEASSDSRLLQLDFLTLQTLMNLGNHQALNRVRE